MLSLKCKSWVGVTFFSVIRSGNSAFRVAVNCPLIQVILHRLSDAVLRTRQVHALVPSPEEKPTGGVGEFFALKHKILPFFLRVYLLIFQLLINGGCTLKTILIARWKQTFSLPTENRLLLWFWDKENLLGLQSAKIQYLCVSIVFIILYIKSWMTTTSTSQGHSDSEGSHSGRFVSLHWGRGRVFQDKGCIEPRLIIRCISFGAHNT